MHKLSQAQDLSVKPARSVMPADKEKEAIQGQNNHMSVLVRDSLSEDRIECFFWHQSHHLLTRASTSLCVCLCARVWLCVFKPQAVCSDDDTACELKLPPCCAELPACVCVCLWESMWVFGREEHPTAICPVWVNPAMMRVKARATHTHKHTLSWIGGCITWIITPCVLPWGWSGFREMGKVCFYGIIMGQWVPLMLCL